MPYTETECLHARRAFPSLARTVNGRPIAYLDGPAGTQVPEPVIAAISGYYRTSNANQHGEFVTSRETDRLLTETREAAAAFLGAPSGHEISFGANMTTLTFALSHALVREMKPGDEIVITRLDHEANRGPWLHLRERGIEIREVALRPDGTLDPEDFARQVTERTRLVAIGAASNALGTVNDLALARRLATGAGAWLLVDAVHYAAHFPVDVQAIDCDFLLCSAYKFYGPHVGVLFGRKALVEGLDAPKLRPAPEHSPDRLETGTQSHEAIVGAAAAVAFLASLGGATAASTSTDRRAALVRAFGELHARGEALFARMWAGLGAIPGVTRYGRPPGEARTPTIAFTLAGRDAGDVAAHLASRGVFASHGDLYAATVVDRLKPGPGGLVRAGCACYTTEAEVDRLVEGVRELGAR
jgi:cysteine desulfurase family protein (TIGR01976 family)